MTEPERDDETECRIDLEEQRAMAQQSLRVAKKAVLLTINERDNVELWYVNVSLIEQRGLAEMISDLAPKWSKHGRT